MQLYALSKISRELNIISNLLAMGYDMIGVHCGNNNCILVRTFLTYKFRTISMICNNYEQKFTKNSKDIYIINVPIKICIYF